MQDNQGQNSTKWNEFWGNVTPISEIRAWDFYGGRQWVSKFAPRFGKVIEAGCGVGRYVFYLKRLGVDIEGMDFSEELIKNLNKEKINIDPNVEFFHGNVTQMPYDDNALSGYISLGVIEHFIEGPHLPLKEAFRVLRPGGIAIITTPNFSFSQYYLKTRRYPKEVIKKILGYPPRPFFQYEYRPKTLKKFIENEGLYISRYEGCDLLYSFGQLLGAHPHKLHERSIPYKLSSQFERTALKNLGAQSICISIKTAPKMYCFLSGELKATMDSLRKFDVPIADEYQDTDEAKLFAKGAQVKFATSYLINPPLLDVSERICDFTGTTYQTDPVFEDFGFNRNVSPAVLLNPSISLNLSTNHLKSTWRRRDLKWN